jgi:pyrroloquinoline quinone biosynthesis protein E
MLCLQNRPIAAHCIALIARILSVQLKRMNLTRNSSGELFKNRSLLIPTRSQVEIAAQVALAARRRLKGLMEVLYVLPDHFTGRPKQCMNGWARSQVGTFYHAQPQGKFRD